MSLPHYCYVLLANTVKCERVWLDMALARTDDRVKHVVCFVCDLTSEYDSCVGRQLF